MLFKDVTQSRFMLWYQKMGVGCMRALHNAKTFGVESEEKRTEHLQIIMLHLLYYIGNFIREKFQFSFPPEITKTSTYEITSSRTVH